MKIQMNGFFHLMINSVRYRVHGVTPTSPFAAP